MRIQVELSSRFYLDFFHLVTLRRCPSKHLFSAFHAGHGIHVLPPVSNLLSLLKEKQFWNVKHKTNFTFLNIILFRPAILNQWVFMLLFGKVDHDWCALSYKRLRIPHVYQYILKLLGLGLLYIPTFYCNLQNTFRKKNPLTFSSSFLTVLRLALKSMDSLCLAPSSAPSMASADTLTLFRLGLFILPFSSKILWFNSAIWNKYLQHSLILSR